MHYVYLLKNNKGNLYYDCTGDLKRRFYDPSSNKSASTKGHKWNIVYYEDYLDENDVWNREKQLKRYGQALAQLKRRLKFSLNKS